MLVHADHLASAACPQHFEVLLANLEKAPMVFSVWLLGPRRVVQILSNHNVGSEHFCLRRLAALGFYQLV
jgi:hypothetical protein